MHPKAKSEWLRFQFLMVMHELAEGSRGKGVREDQINERLHLPQDKIREINLRLQHEGYILRDAGIPGNYTMTVEATAAIDEGWEAWLVRHWPKATQEDIDGGISSDAPLPIQTEFEDFQWIGSGLYGAVWKAQQTKLGRIVALKIVNPRMAHKLNALQHAKSLAQVRHPNVVTVHDVVRVIDPKTGQAADAVVMEWLDGQTLGDFLKLGRIPLPKALDICHQILNGMDAIHNAGVAHGDLHPGNILMTDDAVKIIDIGYAESEALTQLSTIARETYLVRDMDYIRGVVFSTLHRSDVRLDALTAVEQTIRSASSSTEIRKALEQLDLSRHSRAMDAAAKDGDATAGTIARLDRQSLLLMKMYGRTDWFSEPAAFTLGAALDTPAFRSAVQTLQGLGLLRFDVDSDATLYAYHWTDTGLLALRSMGLR